MRRVVPVLALISPLLWLSDSAVAGGKRAAMTAEAHLAAKDGSEAIVFSGGFTGIEGKKCKATAVLKCAISNKVLDRKDCPLQAGGFQGQFGPYDKPFWPQTYVVLISATADFASAKGKQARTAVSLNEAPPTLEQQILVSVHVTTSVDDQREAQSVRFREALMLLRTLFLEVERQVPALKAKYAGEPEKAGKEFDAWWKTWDQRQTSLAKSFLDRSYLNYWGNPFVVEYDALANGTDLLRKYAQRAVVNIAGEEKFDAADRGKDYGTLMKEGKLPSRILREQFLYALASGYETLELADPNRALVEAGATEIAEAFLALRGASHEEGMSPSGAQMKKYRDFRARMKGLVEEVGCFFKGRKNILPGERKVLEQVELLERYLGRMDDLEQKYAAQKDGKLDAAEVQKAELALALGLVRGTLVLAIPSLQDAYDRSWMIYSSLIESYRGTPGFANYPPDPRTVRASFDPAMAKAEKLLASARSFLTSIGESEPGISPVMDLVRRSEEIGAALRKLLAACEQMDALENEKERKPAADAAESRAKEMSNDLAKLKKQMDDVLPPSK